MSKKIMKYEDKTISMNERIKDYSDRIDLAMNPIEKDKFDPDTFEPAGEDMREVSGRVRELPPKLLPVYGLKPKKIREGQMIGMYESKQDIYLTLAHRCNEMQAEIDLLKSKIK